LHTNTKRAVYLAIGVVVFFSVYVTSTQLYGIPIWWALHLIPNSVVSGTDTMAVTISPINPVQVGQPETVTVIDASTRTPLQGVNVSVSLGEGPPILSTSTNSHGQASFSYGGSPTIISFSKNGYNQVNAVLPSEPAQWVSGNDMSVLWGAIGSVPAWVGLLLQLRPKRHNESRRRVKRKSQ
jgi:hypothetical protein